jgi:hypothetical protein
MATSSFCLHSDITILIVFDGDVSDLTRTQKRILGMRVLFLGGEFTIWRTLWRKRQEQEARSHEEDANVASSWLPLSCKRQNPDTL